MTLSIEYQVVQEPCKECAALCDVVRGPVYEDGRGVGLYLALLHGCSAGDTVVFTVALDEPDGAEAWTFQAWPNQDRIDMRFVDGENGPWAGEGYLGHPLSADEARAKPAKAIVFKIADLVCETVPEVSHFLGMSRA